jgi:hypothetical protein
MHAPLTALAALALWSSSLPAVCQDTPKPEEGYDACKRFYDASLGVEAFQWRARALDALAASHDRRALEILRKRYADARPGSKGGEGQGDESAWQLRYFLAGTLTHFLHSGGGADLRAWVQGFKDDSDAWLWYNVLRAHVNQDGAEATVKLVKDRGANKFVRAAAIEVLAKSGSPEVLTLVAELLELKNLPKPGLELRLLATASAAALRAPNLKGSRDSQEYKAAAKAVINLLDIKDIEDLTKLGVARELAQLFGVDERERVSAPWLRRLDKVPEPKGSGSDTGVVPSFMGIRGRGNRFVYVIDFSDSMLVPLTQDDKDEFERGGHDTSVPSADLTKEPTIKLPWNSIRHRLDAARECLRMALRDLTEDKQFAIVLFGDVAETFKSTPGLVKATRANIAAAERELDAFDPMGTTVGDKKGLKGKTNMHGGLRLAFRLTDKAPVPGDDEFVNSLTFTNGADTIFVLTDGIPNWDDFPGKGAPEPDIKTGDPESGRREASKGVDVQYNYPGPYADKTFYLRDVQRLNLFRKVEIHCVGIGEAHSGWLEATARLGNGRSRRVGKDQR